MSQPTRADAHGIGGVEPSTSSAHVTSVDPATQDFAIISIENGSRVKLRKLGNTDIIVLGVSSEPYIKISSQGTFLNQKSATRLINQSTSGSTTAQNETKEFAQTSDDPNTPPVWKKVSSSDTYRWHDHRAHYMGSTVANASLLGASSLVVRTGNTDHTVAFVFTSKPKPASLGFFGFFLGFVAVVLVLVFGFRRQFLTLCSRPIIAFVLVAIILCEGWHVNGYLDFVEKPIFSKLAATLYGLIIMALCAGSLYKIILTKNKGTWNDALRSHAPLLCITGFVGVNAGFIIEYRSFVDQYLASNASPFFMRSAIVVVGCLSFFLFVAGLLYVKPKPTVEQIPSEN